MRIGLHSDATIVQTSLHPCPGRDDTGRGGFQIRQNSGGGEAPARLTIAQGQR